MKFIIALIVFLLSLPCLAQDINKDVKSIVEAVTKSSEKPFITKDACGPICPDDDALEKGVECSEDCSLQELKEKAKLDKGKEAFVLMSGNKYEVLMNSGSKLAFIIGKRTGRKYFTITEDKKNFIGQAKIIYKGPDEKFLKEYERLERIYGDVKFRELCRYLSKNRQRYAKLKAKKID